MSITQRNRLVQFSLSEQLELMKSNTLWNNLTQDQSDPKKVIQMRRSFSRDIYGFKISINLIGLFSLHAQDERRRIAQKRRKRKTRGIKIQESAFFGGENFFRRKFVFVE